MYVSVPVLCVCVCGIFAALSRLCRRFAISPTPTHWPDGPHSPALSLSPGFAFGKGGKREREMGRASEPGRRAHWDPIAIGQNGMENVEAKTLHILLSFVAVVAVVVAAVAIVVILKLSWLCGAHSLLLVLLLMAAQLSAKVHLASPSLLPTISLPFRPHRFVCCLHAQKEMKFVEFTYIFRPEIAKC